MRRILLSIIALAAIVGPASSVSSAPSEGQRTSIYKSHDHVKVVTDPSKGYNTYPAWVQFPPSSETWRKITLKVTYACPDSQHCGEWDYIDGVYLRRTGGQNGPSEDIELARLISPYGWQFDSTWSFTWHVDITDFQFLLHDSAEIVFRHTGYEKSDDRGWVITVAFVCETGRPAVQVLGMDTLWCGSIPFGDPTKPIDSILAPITFKATDSADMVRLRVHQTGHGMDDFENCAEFCDKWREVYFDDSMVARRQIWRKCGDNPLYPQAGTWIFDRANWCPGSMVFPDNYDYKVKPESQHTVDIRMEPYIDTLKPSANYFLYSYLFYCKQPWATNDASLEEIVVPSTDDEYLRMNPACANPVIRVKNSGSDPLTSLIVHYGLAGSDLQTYEWVGQIESQQSANIDLPGPINGPEGIQEFSVVLEEPNGEKDEYQADNTGESKIVMPPVFGTRFVLLFRSNTDSSDNGYYIENIDGDKLLNHQLGSLAANTYYYDTLNLPDGCYQLVVDDTSGTGLDFWFNPEGGYGFVRMLDMNGHLLHAFNSDFGSSIDYWFRTSEDAVPTALPDTPLVTPFPPRNEGKFDVEVFLNNPTDISIQINPADSERVVFEQSYTKVKEAFLPIDISSAPDGVYYVKLTAGDKTASRRIRIKRQKQ